MEVEVADARATNLDKEKIIQSQAGQVAELKEKQKEAEKAIIQVRELGSEKERLLKEKEYIVKRNRKKGPADWTILDNSCSILIECKSLAPNLQFKSMIALKLTVEI